MCVPDGWLGSGGWGKGGALVHASAQCWAIGRYLFTRVGVARLMRALRRWSLLAKTRASGGDAPARTHAQPKHVKACIATLLTRPVIVS